MNTLALTNLHRPLSGSLKTPPLVVAFSLAALSFGGRAVAGPSEHGSVLVKFGEGVRFASADGNTGLALKARVQVRGTFSKNDAKDEPTADATIRRLRLTLEGFALRKRLTYKLQLAAASQDLDPVAPLIIRDAYANYAFHRDFELRFGQMKVPYGRQRVVSSGNLQMVDRSIVTGEFNLDRDIGLQALSNDLFGAGAHLGYQLAVFGGDGRGRVSGGFGLLYAARLEWRVFGGQTSAELDEPDFMRSSKPRLALGASAAFNHKTDRRRSTTDEVLRTGAWLSYAHVGLDTVFKYRGLSLTTELFLRDAMRDSNSEVLEGKLVVDRARSGYGGFLQGGYFVSDNAELTARVGGIYPLAGVDVGSKPQREVGGGISYYFFRHALKLQADYFRLIEDQGQSRHQVRLQVQFAP